MTLSYCLPCHKRVADLHRALPYLSAAVQVQPVEVVIVDYANPSPLVLPPWVTHVMYRGRDHFHMAHARNLGIRAATGDYVMIASADFLPAPTLFEHVRAVMEQVPAVWYQPTRYCGAIVCHRESLLAAGGYDERFEFYGPEDKELAGRLTRRYGAPQVYDADLLSVIPTPDAVKVQGYRLPLSKREMHEHGLPILKESETWSALIANKGLGWGH